MSGNDITPFHVKDCALLRIATGTRAQNLKELGEKLRTVHTESIHYHCWGRKLRSGFEDPEYNNDFASWAHLSLHDDALAERLSVIDPSHSSDPESLRRELIDVIDNRLYETEIAPASRQDEQFHFVSAQTVVFDTGQVIQSPEELRGVIPDLSDGSIFYHFIDAIRRTPGKTDDFSAWLSHCGNSYEELSDRISRIEPYFLNMREIRESLDSIVNGFFQEGTHERLA